MLDAATRQKARGRELLALWLENVVVFSRTVQTTESDLLRIGSRLLEPYELN